MTEENLMTVQGSCIMAGVFIQKAAPEESIKDRDAIDNLAIVLVAADGNYSTTSASEDDPECGHLPHHPSSAEAEGTRTHDEEYPPDAEGTRAQGGDYQDKEATDIQKAENRISSAPEVPSSNSKNSNNNPLGSPYTFKEYTFAISAGVLLSFNSGYVNGSCYSGLVAPSGRQQTVTSHTGTITKSALYLAEGDEVETFGFLISMLLCFAAGSYIAGLLTPNAKPFRIMPTYGPTFLIGSIFLTISSVLAALEVANENYIFYFAAAANGLQNGVSSIYSQNLIRSTGLTGTSTDIGLFIGQLLRGNRKNTWKLIVLLSLAAAFWTGGLVSFYATNEFTHYSLLANAALFFLIGAALVAFLTLELDISIGAAIFGNWRWKNAMFQLQSTFATDENSTTNNNASEERGGAAGNILDDEQLDIIFTKVDTDASGDIDVRELFAALKEANLRVSKREAALMLKRADSDRNGTIDRHEWREMAKACQVHNKSSRSRIDESRS